jgi:four helix bundle protein
MNANPVARIHSNPGSRVDRNPGSRVDAARVSADPVAPRPLPHRRLVAYEVAVEFLRAILACSISDARLREQATKSAKSVCLNIAEGAGRFSRADKARCYAIARGEAIEAAAAVEIGRADGLVERAVRRGEVLAAHGGAIVGETFTDIEKHRLRGARRLVAKLGVADPRALHERRELKGKAVDIEPLEREHLVNGRSTDCVGHRSHHAPRGWVR